MVNDDYLKCSPNLHRFMVLPLTLTKVTMQLQRNEITTEKTS